MPDCPNADLRDLLPDYAHGALTTAERAHVDAHLAACAACRDELALLRAVRAMRPTPAVPDVARIVAALPRPSVPAEHAARDVVALDTRRRRGARGLPWRRIAGIAAVLVGVVGIGLFGRRGESENRNAPTVVPGEVANVASGAAGASATATATASAGPVVAAQPDSPSASGASRSRVRSRQAEAADAVGALGGIASGATEDELEALIGELESLSGIPEVESIEGEESVRSGGVR